MARPAPPVLSHERLRGMPGRRRILTTWNLAEVAPHLTEAALKAFVQPLTPSDNWIARVEAGGYVWLGPGEFIATQTVDLPDNLVLDGSGIDITTIRLPNDANHDILRSAGFAAKTGTDVGGGPTGVTVRGLTIDGNRANNTTGRGIVLYAADFVLKDIRVHHCAGDGVWSEWADIGDQPSLPHAMESYTENVKSHHNGGLGFNVQGPHDGFWKECVGYHNDGGQFRIHRNAHGTLFRTCHAWGEGAFGVSIEQNGAQWEHGDAEVPSTATGAACLIVAANDVRVSGKVWSPGPEVENGSYGLQLGLPGKPATNLRADVHVTGTSAGVVRYLNSGGLNRIAANTWLTVGQVIAGTPHPTDVLDIPAPGGLRPDYTKIGGGELVRATVATSVIRQRIAVPNSPTSRWVRLGRWTATAAGARLAIELTGTAGFGATRANAGRTTILLSTGDGQFPNVQGFWRHEGTGASPIAQCRVVASGHDGSGRVWDVLAEVRDYTGSTFASVELGTDVALSTFDWRMETTTDPGWISATLAVLDFQPGVAGYESNPAMGAVTGRLAVRDQWGGVIGYIPVHAA